jgi:MerR family transcriptional regulator/heat shock protein HspR
MVQRKTSREMRVTITDWLAENASSDEPRYAISVVAARCGVQQRTLHRYEEWGILEPARSGQGRLYSEADIERIMRVRRLVDDLGMNLAGAAAVLHLRQQVIALQRELDALRDALDGTSSDFTGSSDRRG